MNITQVCPVVCSDKGGRWTRVKLILSVLSHHTHCSLMLKHSHTYNTYVQAQTRMHICMCICMYVCVHVHINTITTHEYSTALCTQACVHTHTCARAYEWTDGRMQTYTHTNLGLKNFRFGSMTSFHTILPFEGLQ